MVSARVLFWALAFSSACAPRQELETTTPTTAPSPSAGVECFCMSWVHLDENGEYCYPTRAACDENFASFARTDKLACRVEVKPVCERIACRGSGAECFRQP